MTLFLSSLGGVKLRGKMEIEFFRLVPSIKSVGRYTDPSRNVLNSRLVIYMSKAPTNCNN